MKLLKYFLLGVFFGFVLIKSEVISWYRIQEMFRFQSFHMYGIICSALAVGIVSYALLRKFKVRSLDGELVEIRPRPFNKGTIIGGLIFGFGWALAGACPGPLYALLGSGIPAFAVVVGSALTGVFVYGLVQDKLPQ